MAVSSAAAAVSLSPRNFPPAKIAFTKSISFPTKLSRRFVSTIRNSGDVAEEASATTLDRGIEVPESLISALNVERALRGLPITDKDYYGLLGLPRNCRSEEVIAGTYKAKVEDVLSEGLDEEEVTNKLELLKEAYRVLSTVEERRLYDWSLSRSASPETYSWPFEVDETVTSVGDPPPQEPEDVGPTRLVGYVFLGWVIVSFIMSALLNSI